MVIHTVRVYLKAIFLKNEMRASNKNQNVELFEAYAMRLFTTATTLTAIVPVVLSESGHLHLSQSIAQGARINLF